MNQTSWINKVLKNIIKNKTQKNINISNNKQKTYHCCEMFTDLICYQAKPYARLRLFLATRESPSCMSSPDSLSKLLKIKIKKQKQKNGFPSPACFTLANNSLFVWSSVFLLSFQRFKLEFSESPPITFINAPIPASHYHSSLPLTLDFPNLTQN